MWFTMYLGSSAINKFNKLFLRPLLAQGVSLICS